MSQFPDLIPKRHCRVGQRMELREPESFFFFNWRIITILWWFLPYIDMNQPWVAHVFPHPEPLSHLLPYPVPLGFPRVLALSVLLHASNLHWSSTLHMVIYMFQCYSFISSNPCLLPHSPSLFFTPVSLLLTYI